MATKTLDKWTKAELIAELQRVRIIATKFDAQLVQRTADVKRLQVQLDRLETRRKYENAAHVAKRREHGNGEPRAVSPARAAMEKAREEAMRTGKCVPVQLR